MKEYNWIVEAPDGKYQVWYKAGERFARVDGRKVELLLEKHNPKMRMQTAQRMPIDGVHCFLHITSRGMNPSLTVDGVLVGGETDTKSPEISPGALGRGILCLACCLSLSPFGVIAGLAGLGLCLLLDYQLQAMGEGRLSKKACSCVMAVCLVLFVVFTVMRLIY